MERPWHNYLLLFVGTLSLLAATFRPMVGAAREEPGAAVDPATGRILRLIEGRPLARAGLRVGDLLRPGELLRTDRTEVRWRQPIPQGGELRVLRGDREVVVPVRPAPPSAPVRALWALVGLLNVGLCALALALFWQRPREGPAVLLGLVLLGAPVFLFPGEPRLLALVLAAHFLTVFPPGPPPGRAARGLRLAGLYGPFLVLGFLGLALLEEHPAAATLLFQLLAVGYALYGLVRVLVRWRTAPPEQRPAVRTLTLFAGAMLLAVGTGLVPGSWVVADQYIPANLLPALLFSGAVAHLVFRLRAMEVRFVARRTLQYLLARWTLGTLFLIPGLLLVYRLGQVAGSRQEPNGAEVLGFLVWMFAVAVLSGKRQQVLRRLDRRFFRDVDQRRQALIRLAQEVGEEREASAVLARLDQGLRESLRPASLRFAVPDELPTGEVALVIPVRRGDRDVGQVFLGPREGGEPYSEEERELLAAVGLQAATALESAALGRALLDRQREELAARSAGLIAGAEEERRRLAADLHDQVLPELRQIAAEVEHLQPRANGLEPDLHRLAGDIRGTMDGVREVMEALRPSALDVLGLGDALESYLRKAAARRDPPLTVTVRREGPEPELTPEQSLALYRIVQEGINNVVRHSGAGRAGLEIESWPEGLHLILWDDGVGFDPEQPSAGRGLDNIRYRAELIGAQVRWEGGSAGGTRLEVRLPAGTPSPHLDEGAPSR